MCIESAGAADSVHSTIVTPQRSFSQKQRGTSVSRDKATAKIQGISHIISQVDKREVSMSYSYHIWSADLSFNGFKIAYFDASCSLVSGSYLNINQVISLVNSHNTLKFQTYCNLKMSKEIPSGSIAQEKKVFIVFHSK